ncbi:hypothetical protein JCM10449v2_002128 [Rhodotorula kratochvilovae]
MPASPSSSRESSTALPLASFVAEHAPSHPLPRLLVDPVVPRVAALEAALLTSRPATLLLRLGIASELSIVALALVALVGALARWRSQWRAVLWALGLGEALGRTVRLLQRADSAAAGGANAKGKARARSDDADEQDVVEETQHVLSFWLLVAALSLFDTLRSTPSGAAAIPSSRLAFLALPERVRTALRSVRHTYLHFIRLYILPTVLRARWAGRAFIERNPSFNPAPHLAKLPALPSFPYTLPSFASSRPTRVGSFPQPRSRPWDPLPMSLPLSWSYFAYPSSFSPSPALPAYSARACAAAEARWEALKLVLLWAGLRRDAWGAKSLVWDWVVGPLLSALPRPGAEEGTVLRVVREPRAPPAVTAPLDRPHPSQDDPLPPSPAPSSLASATPQRPYAHHPARGGAAYPSPSPHAYAYSLAWTPPRAAPASVASARTSSHAPTPRLVRSPSFSHASTRTASPRPFVLHDPPAGRAGVAGYRSAAAEHPLIPVQGPGRAARAERDSLLFEESPPRSPLLGGAEGYGSAGSAHEEDAEGDASDVPPPTPGEEEAEEGARRWAAVLAEAQAQGRLAELEEAVRAAEGGAHGGGSGWSASG